MNFFHCLKYSLKTMLKNKLTLMWTFLFPIALSTFMYMAFGNIFEKDEIFKTIPVAVVNVEENKAFREVLDTLAGEEGGSLISIEAEDEDSADKMLDDGKITGIIYVADKPSLKVKEQSVSATILRTVIEEYVKNEAVITDVVNTNPAGAADAVAKLTSGEKYFTEKTSSHGVQNEYYNYFYAIFAMSCLFASFAGSANISKLQANESALGMRRCLSPQHKMVIVSAEYISMLFVQFAIECVTLVYLSIIGINFGDRYPALILILFVGSSIGISMGAIIGSFSGLSSGTRDGLCVAISMILSILADLCVGGIKNTIEQNAPIINRINPAALISDSFYALNVYEDYSRYTSNMIILASMAAVMLIVCVLILRRNKYASV